MAMNEHRIWMLVFLFLLSISAQYLRSLMVQEPLEVHREPPIVVATSLQRPPTNTTTVNHTVITAKTSHYDVKPGHKIALGCAVTTKKVPHLGVLKTSSPFFRHLLPSFCKTASDNYLYTFYVGYDHDDHILKDSKGTQAFAKAFNDITTYLCRKTIKVELSFLKCNYSKRPAWSQNDALMAGYHDNADYLYMVNDDTIMETKRWTEAFISALGQMTPPNVGMVGPQHRGGSTAILTYNFVHRTHIDIFGYFYPRAFTDWYGDQWITRIYKPNNVNKVSQILVKHTLETGTRYKVHTMKDKVINDIINKTHDILRAKMGAYPEIDINKSFPKYSQTLGSKIPIAKRQ